jgi:dephospho-CoA kinase
MKTPPVDIIKVAVTGGAGSGKTFVCNRLRELGLNVVSSDAVARETVAKDSPAYNRIVNHFGKKILLNDGHLNRQTLRCIIINDNAERLALEKIIHPEITKKMMQKVRQAQQTGDAIVVLEIPLLFELAMEDNVDAVVVISTDPKLRTQRLMDRDNVARSEAEKLLKAQLPDEFKVERAHIVLRNDGSKKKLTKSVDALYKNIIKMKKKDLKSLDTRKIMI